MKNSKRKRVFVGTQEMAYTSNGEVTRAMMMQLKEHDRNFIKFFLPEAGNHMMRPKEMTLTTVDLFNYLCVICGQDNIAITTTAEITERIGMSTASISRAKDQLYEFDYIRKRANNVYMINPEIAAKTDGEKRQALWEKYQLLKRHNIS